MMKNEAIPVSVLKSGDEKKIKKYGPQKMNAAEIEQMNADANAYAEFEGTEKYQYDRRIEYPPLAELADAIYWRERGDGAPMQAWLEKVDAIKAKYPKPEKAKKKASS